jgi:hypothetical protein
MEKLGNKGNIAILMCFVITALCGFTAFVIDIGITYSEKAKLSNALDAAALAAVLELPASNIKAKAVAEDYMRKNNVDPTKATIVFSADNRSIQISSSKIVNHFIAPIIGIDSSTVKAKTKAMVAPLKSVSAGIRPFAVVTYNFTYGDQVILKKGAGSGYHGNYNVVALGGSGSSVFEQNALYGYRGQISVGDWIDTEPGNMAGATNRINNYISGENSTFDNFQRDSIRLWTIPIVNTLAVNGRSQIQVTGFAEFFVENATKSGGHMELTGRFIRYVVNGDYDPTLSDTGLYSAKLTE